MKISLGVDCNDTLADLEHYIELGAGEFFCGCVPGDWQSGRSGEMRLNKRRAILAYESFDRLATVCSTAHRHGCEVYVTLNSHYYLPQQYPYLVEYAGRVAEAGADAVIVSDIALIRSINRTWPAVSVLVSGEVGVYNRSTIELLLTHCNIRRIILPRQISLAELAAVARDREVLGEVELEVFAMNGRCPFEGAGYCQVDYVYSEEGHVCLDPDYRRRLFPRPDYSGLLHGSPRPDPVLDDQTRRTWQEHEEQYELWRYSGYLATQGGSRPGEHGWGACALCAVPVFRELGIAALKVVTRGESRESKRDCVRVLQEVIRDPAATPASIRSRLLADPACRLGFRCHYGWPQGW